MAAAHGAAQARAGVNLAGVDLNLLVALEALLVCQNVTHAARRLGQTQPAMSRALSRLRDLLDDDLLVRGSAGMKLTERGAHLARTLPATMAHLRDVVSTRQVDVGFRVSVDSNLAPVLLPEILQSPRFDSGALKLNTHNSADDGVVQLRTRAVDYMLGAAAPAAPDIETALVMVEDYVTLIAPQSGERAPTRAGFLDLVHINLAGSGREHHPLVIQALIAQGLSRAKLLEVPDVTSAALMVSEGGMALRVPRSVAVWLTRTLNLTALRPPVEIPGYAVVLSWLAGAGEGSSGDAGRRHLVAQIEGATRAAIAPDTAPLRLLSVSLAQV